ncbi:MAG: YXWGXW repeat-containing protein [Zoogloeaceae bacterium]|nr:YXWGXW repeat-containing protein [Zoogloeaceae bacterium]
MKNRTSLTASLMAATVFLGGCAVTPAAGPRYYEPVRVAPPPPNIEHVGMPPVVGHVWISGYWNWGGARYVWVPGHWEAPRHGHYWVPHRWERDGDHWRQHGGHWAKGHQQHQEARPVRQFEPRVPPHVVHQRETAPEVSRSQRHKEFRDEREDRQVRDASPPESRRPGQAHDNPHRYPERRHESASAPVFEQKRAAGVQERQESSGRRERDGRSQNEERKGRETNSERINERSNKRGVALVSE